MKVKWMTLENIDATATLKQHAFKPVLKKKPYTLEPYEGNKAVCSKHCASDDGETASLFNDLEGEVLNVDKACKKCLKILDRI